MKANELRIGNYVKLQGVNRPIRVSIIDTTETSEQTNAEPIPLTEEILLKCGFRKISSVIYIKNKITINVFSDVGVCFSLNERFSKIQYLHQLQNLYFALTNEELQIEL